jgi:HlyD family secretion protein
MFREKAMAQVLGPDPIDQVMTITRPAGWIQLGALGALVAAAVVWGALAEVPLKIKARGVLLNERGLVEIATVSRGRIDEMDVNPGDVVRKGDLIAVAAQPDFDSQLAIRRAQLAESESHERSLTGFNGQLAAAQSAAATSRARAARERIRLLTERERELAERDANLASLAAKGFVSKEPVLRNASELSSVREAIANARADAVSADNEEKVQAVQRQRDLATTHSDIARLKAELAQLESQGVTDREVRSPYSGRITEVRHGVGEFVETGTPIASLAQSLDDARQSEGQLHAIAFVPAEQGKEIKRGMRVDLAPSGVKSSEYGFIVGRVIDVDVTPASTAGMMRVLRNDQLVRKLSEQGAPFKVTVALETAPTHSGYRWSSSGGPKARVDTGTPVEAQFVTGEQRLLGLVIPPLARFFAK